MASFLTLNRNLLLYILASKIAAEKNPGTALPRLELQESAGHIERIFGQFTHNEVIGVVD